MTCRVFVLIIFALWATFERSVAQKRDMIALAGSGVDKIAIIEKATGREVWNYILAPGTECNTVAVRPNGNVIFSYKQGVCEITSKGKKVWDFKVDRGNEAQTARLLPSGDVLMGVCGNPVRIIEVDKRGEIVREVNYDLGIEKAHSQFRQMVKSTNGNYLIPVISQSKVVEINTRGEKIGEWKVPATPFSVKELEGGNLLVSTIGQLVEIDRKSGEKIAVVARGAFANGADTLRFSTEAARLADGNTMVSNWQGYARNTDAQLLELAPDGQVVWQFRDTSMMRNISGFYIFKR